MLGLFLFYVAFAQLRLPWIDFKLIIMLCMSKIIENIQYYTWKTFVAHLRIVKSVFRSLLLDSVSWRFLVFVGNFKVIFRTSRNGRFPGFRATVVCLERSSKKHDMQGMLIWICNYCTCKQIPQALFTIIIMKLSWCWPGAYAASVAQGCTRMVYFTSYRLYACMYMYL